MLTLTEGWAYLGQLGLTAVVAAGAAWGLFRYFGEKWITNKFSAQLESFKHAQQQEIEKLRLRINTVFDRTVKFYSSEFEVLPELWSLLSDTFHHANAVLNLYQEFPDLDRMTGPELEHFLVNADLPEFQREEIRQAGRKSDAYSAIRSWKLLGDAEAKRMKFYRYFLMKNIFLSEELKEQIEKLNEMVGTAVIERRIQLEEPKAKKDGSPEWKALDANGPDLHKAIGAAIQKRLTDTTGV